MFFCLCFLGLDGVVVDGSGIGPREGVEKLGVEVKVDLPGVGQHLVLLPLLDA